MILFEIALTLVLLRIIYPVLLRYTLKKEQKDQVKNRVMIDHEVYDLFVTILENYQDGKNKSDYICAEITRAAGLDSELKKEAMEIMKFYMPSKNQFPEIYNHHLFDKNCSVDAGWWDFFESWGMDEEVKRQKIKFLELLIGRLTIINEKKGLPRMSHKNCNFDPY